MSGGRIGWNAITTSDQAAAANFGAQVADGDARYVRAHEVVQIVQALWGSWQEDAWIADQKTGVFSELSKKQPVNLQGNMLPHVPLWGSSLSARTTRYFPSGWQPPIVWP